MPNPYQPPSAIDREPDLSEPAEVTFQLNERLRRHATDQYLLHWHPYRLSISSLLMILISGTCLVASIRYGLTAFLSTMIGVLLISAAIYTALVHRTRKRVRVRVDRFGLTTGEFMTLRSDADQLTLVCGGEVHVWSNDQLQIHGTRRGLLICPEPLLFVFVPKTSDFQSRTYGQFVKVIKSRTHMKGS